jgi:hypothetical protein
MIKRVAPAIVLGLVMAGSALAQSATPTETAEQPSTVEACIAAAASLGSVAEGKTLSEEKLDQLDQLFSKMEALCDGKQFSEAMAVANDIKTMLDGQ